MAFESFHFSERYPMPDEDVLRRLELSEREFLTRRKRKLPCPQCGFRILDITEERCGIAQVKCQNCKFSGPMSLRLFRSQKKTGRHIHMGNRKRSVRKEMR